MAKVCKCAQTLKVEMFEGPEKECEEFCDMYNWEFWDENDFCWYLEII